MQLGRIEVVQPVDGGHEQLRRGRLVGCQSDLLRSEIDCCTALMRASGLTILNPILVLVIWQASTFA